MKEITDRHFNKEVLGCKIPVFVCFTTKWCHTCYPTCYFANQLIEEYDGVVKFVRVDIEESPAIAERYHIIPVPTILIFRNAQPVEKLLGFQEQRALRDVLNSVANESNKPRGRTPEVNEASG